MVYTTGNIKIMNFILFTLMKYIFTLATSTYYTEYLTYSRGPYSVIPFPGETQRHACWARMLMYLAAEAQRLLHTSPASLTFNWNSNRGRLASLRRCQCAYHQHLT